MQKQIVEMLESLNYRYETISDACIDIWITGKWHTRIEIMKDNSISIGGKIIGDENELFKWLLDTKLNV